MLNLKGDTKVSINDGGLTNYSGGKFSIEQFTPNQMGSSRTPTCRMKNSLRLSPLISKQAKSKESKRPKPKILELKPFESSSYSKPSPSLEPKILSDHSTLLVEIADQHGGQSFGRFHCRLALSFGIIFSKISSAADHSVSLVEIADKLGDPPFGRFHRYLALSFSIVVFGSLGDILSTLEQKARKRLFGDSSNEFGNSQIFISSFFQLPLFLFS
ncbi:hypothetical protein H5410_021337 [Solanum commersonii]|uniref:Uncharacterized protein n=1 Tax=Solanum commersonii TaxID=4109 RepID=A0A9J5ZDY7_SOLCO|nr:hypothetical protein H5410_021337 [Solanum commersonii]